jgi:glycosyltransferase involved in cell wall biosynthesis
MGTATTFQNLQEAAPPDVTARSVWIGVQFRPPVGRIARLPLPYQLRSSLDLLNQILETLRRHRGVTTLVIANLPPSPAYLFLVLRYSTYIYMDLTPSLVTELSPWYDTLLPRRGLAGAIQRHLLRVVHQKAAGVFPMSKWAADGVRRDYGVPPERIHVVPPGANLRRWGFVDRSGRDSAQPVRILMVGADFTRKGGELLLEWAEKTLAEHWELDILTAFDALPAWVRGLVGSPDTEGRVSASLAPRLPRVRVHCGVRANTPEHSTLYEQADIFCLPTLGDASPIAAIEAMASGLPVVVSALGGIPELVCDGETGVLVRPGDVSNLAARLEELLADADLRVRLGRAARAACEDRFTIDRLLRDFVGTIDADGRNRQSRPVASSA